MDILSLKYSKAIQSSKKLLVLKIGYRGDALIWRRERGSYNDNKKEPTLSFTKFRLCNKPRPQDERIINTRRIPDVGDYIEAGKFGKVRLSRTIGEGGEGKIFSTDSVVTVFPHP